MGWCVFLGCFLEESFERLGCMWGLWWGERECFRCGCSFGRLPLLLRRWVEVDFSVQFCKHLTGMNMSNWFLVDYIYMFGGLICTCRL